ncbi:hypothetical protein D3C77_451190 [compost metagenome]
MSDASEPILKKDNVGVFCILYISPLVIVVCAVCAIYYYRTKFGGEFSGQSADWSAFGSYVGGVFGPLVSFVTLLAVLNTVDLQRKLLSSQLSEFDRMNKLQQQTFDSQQHQINQAAREALLLQIAAAQDSAVKAIEMRMNMHEHDFDRQHDMSFRFRAEFGHDMNEENFSKLENIIEHRDRARESVDMLSKVALDIAVGSFASVLEVRTQLKDRILDVYSRLDAAYPKTVKRADDQRGS